MVTPFSGPRQVFRQADAAWRAATSRVQSLQRRSVLGLPETSAEKVPRQPDGQAAAGPRDLSQAAAVRESQGPQRRLETRLLCQAKEDHLRLLGHARRRRGCHQCQHSGRDQVPGTGTLQAVSTKCWTKFFVADFWDVWGALLNTSLKIKLDPCA